MVHVEEVIPFGQGKLEAVHLERPFFREIRGRGSNKDVVHMEGVVGGTKVILRILQETEDLYQEIEKIHSGQISGTKQ
jgi:hypothetical protein